MNRPHRNEKRFYRYPMHRVAAIVDDDSGVDDALRALAQTGTDVTAVDVLSGPEGARLLDRTGSGHGWGARALRLLQRGAFEGDALEAHDRALTDGHHVLFVPVRSDPEFSGVVDVLRSAGAQHVLWFRRWSIVKP